MSYVVKIKARYTTNIYRKTFRLPALLTENGLLISHLRFLAENSNKSQSWIERNTYSVMLLVKYINANGNKFVAGSDLLRSFVIALTFGTIDRDTLEDNSGLYWSPRKARDANIILYHITSYTDFLSEKSGHKENRINPFRKATSIEERLNYCAHIHRQDRSFLKHLSQQNKEKYNLNLVRKIRAHRPPMYRLEDFFRFPASKISKLLNDGFVRRNSTIGMPPEERTDFKNQAITYLMHFGGLRKSEIFHIYESDILVDEKRLEAVVRVFHPSDGESPAYKYNNRREYLLKEFGLPPRTDYPKTERLHAGWKDPLLTDRRNFFQVIFCPTSAAREFLYIWTSYLKYQRVAPSDNAKHPYAFTNSKGEPETIKNFQRMHSDAVRRIGLSPKKTEGTTEHGHRHAYGYELAKRGFNQYEIQKAMHHKSPDSCLIYIQASGVEIRDAMKKTEAGEKSDCVRGKFNE